MSKLPKIHLCLQQPMGYVHSLGLLDQARYFRYQFRRLGAEVTPGEEPTSSRRGELRLRRASRVRRRSARTLRLVVVNLEQLGHGGAQVSPDYLRLLASSAVVDYDPENPAAYAAHPNDITIAPLLHAPYLAPAHPIASRSGRSTCSSSAA